MGQTSSNSVSFEFVPHNRKSAGVPPKDPEMGDQKRRSQLDGWPFMATATSPSGKKPTNTQPLSALVAQHLCSIRVVLPSSGLAPHLSQRPPCITLSVSGALELGNHEKPR
jgi:hypothetical protein